MAELTAPTTPSGDATRDAAAEYQERVLDVLRDLARQLGGARRAHAVTPGASIERDLGLGSLERVELVAALEERFGRPLDDRFLLLDTATDIARALVAIETGRAARSVGRAAPLPAAPVFAPEDSTTIHGALWQRALDDRDRPHVYLRDDDGREEEITYGRLWDEAAAVAGGLIDRGIQRGDTVALMLPTSFDFLRSFHGILIAGAVPVPLYPPVRLDRFEEYAVKQTGILNSAEVRGLITIARALPIAAVLRAAVPSMKVVTTAAELARTGAPLKSASGDESDPALIQYTSGSTGNPKGVLLTHANLVSNIRAIARGVRMTPRDVGTSWLPLYHDMGLIGSWLCCLYHGIPIAIQSPLAFLARPDRWLWSIHQHRATLSAAPNFAYELCVRRIPDKALEGLDLSSWRCALNGAEPVSPDTLDRFASRFAKYGFRREALLPVYGLAECSVALTIPPLSRGPVVLRLDRDAFEQEGRAIAADDSDQTALRFVSVGEPIEDHEVRIVNDSQVSEVAEQPDGVVGRLIFRGPSTTQGYYRNPEATAAITLDDGWLDSGDLAFREGSEIFITGRRKDLIIKAGRNLVPQEIEDAAASVDGVRKGCVVAFGVENAALGTESLVVVAETRATEPEEKNKLEAEVMAAVAAAVGVPPDRVIMAEPGAVLKTSSGKIRRSSTKELYVAGSLGDRARERTSWRRRISLVIGAALSPVRTGLARAGYGIYLGYIAVMIAVMVPLIWLLAKVLPGRAAMFTLGRTASRALLRLFGCRLSVEGSENIPLSGGVLLASNHTSYADIPTLLALIPRNFLFVAKHDVVSWPLIGAFVRKAGHIPVDRLDVQQSLADASAVPDRLADGEAILFFAEGTFRDTTGLRPFRLGAFAAAVETGIPVVPVAIRGARQFLRGDSRRPRPGRIHLWIGKPISPEGTGLQAVVALRDRVAAAIAEHCGEPQLNIVSGHPLKG